TCRHQLVERAGQFRTQAAGSGRRGGCDLVHDGQRAGATKRETTRRGLVQDAAERKNVKRSSTVAPCVCSGDIYETVPTIAPGIVTSTMLPVGPSGSCSAGEIILATPKSRTLTR